MRFLVLCIRLLIVSTAGFLFSCSSEVTQEPKEGIVLVRVVDMSTEDPVAGVEVKLAGTNIDAKTDSTGGVKFNVPPGDYFVDAKVCCAGPGFIEYHHRVSVVSGGTSNVDLHACLMCVSSERVLVEGTVEFVDVEGGCWRIRADDGTAYEPIGLPREFAEDGLRVRVVFSFPEDMGSICQVGRIAEVEDIKKIGDP